MFTVKLENGESINFSDDITDEQMQQVISEANNELRATQSESTPATEPKADEGFLSQAGRIAKDEALTLDQGILGSGQRLIGAADLVTGGAASDALNYVGEKATQAADYVHNKIDGTDIHSQGGDTLMQGIANAKESVGDNLSSERKQQDANLQNAHGWDKVGAAVDNPEAILGAITESLPDMVIGMGLTHGIAQGIAIKAAGGLEALATPEGQVLAKAAIEQATGKLLLTGNAIEGIQSAGGIAEQAERDGKSYGDYAPQALGAGVATAAIGNVSGRLMGDAATDIVAGTNTMKGGILAKAGKGFVSEGVLEEAPQSASETAFTNDIYKDDASKQQSVLDSAIEGGIVGGVMGAGMGGASGFANRKATETQTPASDISSETLNAGNETLNAVTAHNVPSTGNDNLDNLNSMLNDTLGESEKIKATVANTDETNKEINSIIENADQDKETIADKAESITQAFIDSVGTVQDNHATIQAGQAGDAHAETMQQTLDEEKESSDEFDRIKAQEHQDRMLSFQAQQDALDKQVADDASHIAATDDIDFWIDDGAELNGDVLSNGTSKRRLIGKQVAYAKDKLRLKNEAAKTNDVLDNSENIQTVDAPTIQSNDGLTGSDAAQVDDTKTNVVNPVIAADNAVATAKENESNKYESDTLGRYKDKITQSKVRKEISDDAIAELSDTVDAQGNSTGWKVFSTNDSVSIINPETRDVITYNSVKKSGTDFGRAGIVTSTIAHELALSLNSNLPQDELISKAIYEPTQAIPTASDAPVAPLSQASDSTLVNDAVKPEEKLVLNEPAISPKNETPLADNTVVQPVDVATNDAAGTDSKVVAPIFAPTHETTSGIPLKQITNSDGEKAFIDVDGDTVDDNGGIEPIPVVPLAIPKGEYHTSGFGKIGDVTVSHTGRPFTSDTLAKSVIDNGISHYSQDTHTVIPFKDGYGVVPIVGASTVATKNESKLLDIIKVNDKADIEELTKQYHGTDKATPAQVGNIAALGLQLEIKGKVTALAGGKYEIAPVIAPVEVVKPVAPVTYDNVEGLITKGGTPFIDPKSAKAKLERTKGLITDEHDVVPVVGGYAIAPTASLDYAQFKALPRNEKLSDGVLSQTFEAETGKVAPVESVQGETVTDSSAKVMPVEKDNAPVVSTESEPVKELNGHTDSLHRQQSERYNRKTDKHFSDAAKGIKEQIAIYESKVASSPEDERSKAELDNLNKKLKGTANAWFINNYGDEYKAELLDKVKSAKNKQEENVAYEKLVAFDDDAIVDDEFKTRKKNESAATANTPVSPTQNESTTNQNEAQASDAVPVSTVEDSSADDLRNGKISPMQYGAKHGLSEDDVISQGWSNPVDTNRITPYKALFNDMYAEAEKKIKALEPVPGKKLKSKTSSTPHKTAIQTLQTLEKNFEHPFNNNLMDKLPPYLQVKFRKRAEDIKTGDVAKSEFYAAKRLAENESLISHVEEINTKKAPIDTNVNERAGSYGDEQSAKNAQSNNQPNQKMVTSKSKHALFFTVGGKELMLGKHGVLLAVRKFDGEKGNHEFNHFDDEITSDVKNNVKEWVKSIGAKTSYDGKDDVYDYSAIAVDDKERLSVIAPAKEKVESAVTAKGEQSSEEEMNRRVTDFDARRETEKSTEIENAELVSANKKYTFGNAEPMRQKLMLQFNIPAANTTLLANLIRANTTHEKYLVVANSGIKSNLQFNKQVDLNGAIRKGYEFGYFDISPRKGYSVATMIIDLAGGKAVDTNQPTQQTPTPAPVANAMQATSESINTSAQTARDLNEFRNQLLETGTSTTPTGLRIDLTSKGRTNNGYTSTALAGEDAKHGALGGGVNYGAKDDAVRHALKTYGNHFDTKAAQPQSESDAPAESKTPQSNFTIDDAKRMGVESVMKGYINAASDKEFTSLLNKFVPNDKSVSGSGVWNEFVNAYNRAHKAELKRLGGWDKVDKLRESSPQPSNLAEAIYNQIKKPSLTPVEDTAARMVANTVSKKIQDDVIKYDRWYESAQLKAKIAVHLNNELGELPEKPYSDNAVSQLVRDVTDYIIENFGEASTSKQARADNITASNKASAAVVSAELNKIGDNIDAMQSKPDFTAAIDNKAIDNLSESDLNKVADVLGVKKENSISDVWTSTKEQAEKANELMQQGFDKGEKFKTYALFSMTSGKQKIILFIEKNNLAVVVNAEGDVSRFDLATLKLSILAKSAKEFTGFLDVNLRRENDKSDGATYSKNNSNVIKQGIYKSALPSTPTYKVDGDGVIYRDNGANSWVRLTVNAKIPSHNLNSVRWDLKNSLNTFDFSSEDKKPDAQQSKKETVSPEKEALQKLLKEQAASLAEAFLTNNALKAIQEEKIKILPLMTDIMETAFKLGYVSFKENARFILDTIGGISQDAADLVGMHHLIGGYVSFSRMGEVEGTTPFAELGAFKSIDDLRKGDDAQEETPVDNVLPDKPDLQFEDKNRLRQLKNTLSQDRHPQNGFPFSEKEKNVYKSEITKLEDKIASATKATGSEPAQPQSLEEFVKDKVKIIKIGFDDEITVPPAKDSVQDRLAAIDKLVTVVASSRMKLADRNEFTKAVKDFLKGDRTNSTLRALRVAQMAFESSTLKDESMANKIKSSLDDMGIPTLEAIINDIVFGGNRGNHIGQQGDNNANEPRADGATSHIVLEGKPESVLSGTAKSGKRKATKSGNVVSTANADGNGYADDGQYDDVGTSVGSQSGTVHSNESESFGFTDAGLGVRGGVVDNGASQDFILQDSGLGEGTKGEKIRNNLAAIRLIKTLDTENRPATQDEKRVLSQYIGWGGLKTVFATNPPAKQDRDAQAELKQLLTDTEYREANAGVLAQHFTSPEIVAGIYNILDHLGFKGGNALEPTVGTGNFIGSMPIKMRGATKWFASEIDTTPSKIAKYLYPEAQIEVATGFQNAEFPYAKFDLVIGNPPFGGTTISDTSKDAQRKEISGLKIHNYIIAKAGLHLKPGGIMSFVVTSRFLDTANDEARALLAKNFDMLAAIRLPNDAFKGNAGTEVTTDIIIMQKRFDNAPATNQDWLDTKGEIIGAEGTPVRLNAYFANHPEMMLGTPSMAGTMYSHGDPNKKEFTLIPHEGKTIASQIENLIATKLDSLKDLIAESHNQQSQVVANDTVIAMNRSDVGIGGFITEPDGKIYMRRDNDANGNMQFDEVTPTMRWTEKALLNVKRYTALKGLLGLRGKAYALINAETTDGKNIEGLRADLNTAYDAFVKENGYINDKVNKVLVANDPRIELALEKNHVEAVDAKKAAKNNLSAAPASADKNDLLLRRVNHPYKTITSAANPHDGYLVSMSEKGRLDIDYIAELTGLTSDKVIADLSSGETPLIYKNPVSDKWESEDDYLSGNVKKKLAEAKSNNLSVNIKALEAVQPEDLKQDDIFTSLGQTWIPEYAYEHFLEELGITTKVHVDDIRGRVNARNDRGTHSAKTIAAEPFENKYFGIASLFNLISNGKSIVAFDGTGSEKVVNPQATKELGVIATRLKAFFKDWIFADPERAADIVRIYNETQNTTVEREYKGKHLKTVGANPSITLRDTQKTAAWRMIQSQFTLLDHVVGAGKTMTIITGIMERKRLGLSNKPLIAVPNHLVGQWAQDFLSLYPNAKILAAKDSDFSTANRKMLMARIATGRFDAVIIGHSSLTFIPLNPEDEQRFVNEEIGMLIATMKEAAANGEKQTVASIEKRIEAKSNRLVELRDIDRDSVVDMKQMGIDYLAIDESHLFKNLEYSTAMKRVAGMGNPNGSKRAFDLYMKMRVMAENPDAGITFATGTPISNSLVEMYSIMRFLNLSGLTDRSIQSFDAWAKNYAGINNVIEYTATGKLKERAIMSSFNNVPEMMQIYHQFADVVTMADLKEIYTQQMVAYNKEHGTNLSTKFPVPDVAGGSRQLIKAAPSPEQIEYIDYLVDRTIAIEEAGRDFDPRIDNLLWIFNDAKKNALDARLVDPEAQDFAGSKVNKAVESILDNYHKWNADKGTQLVFIDMSTPAKAAPAKATALIRDILDRLHSYPAKATRSQKDAIIDSGRIKAQLDTLDSFSHKWIYLKTLLQEIVDDESTSGDRAESVQLYINKIDEDVAVFTTADTGFSIYDDIKEKLIRNGIPSQEVQFIHDFDKTDDKTALFAQVNSGEVRILLGSTPKMGAGTNVQERLVALHHIDASQHNRPSDIEQREGRIIRQGNVLYKRDPDNFEVVINAYSTEQTFDAVSWQTLAKKAGMLESFRSGARSIEEETKDAASYLDFMAETTGNPIFKEKVKLDSELDVLEADKRRVDTQLLAANRTIKNAESRKRKLEKEIEGAKKAAELVGDAETFEFNGEVIKRDFAAVEKIEYERYREERDIYDPLLDEYRQAKAEWDQADSETRGKAPKKPVEPESVHKGYGYSKRMLDNSEEARFLSEFYSMIPKVNNSPVTLKIGNLEIELEFESDAVTGNKINRVDQFDLRAGYISDTGSTAMPFMVADKLLSGFSKDLYLNMEYHVKNSLQSHTENVAQATSFVSRVKGGEFDAKIEKLKMRLFDVNTEIKEIETQEEARRNEKGNKYKEGDITRFGVTTAEGVDSVAVAFLESLNPNNQVVTQNTPATISNNDSVSTQLMQVVAKENKRGVDLNSVEQPKLDSDELASLIADGLRGQSFRFRKVEDGNYDVRVNDVAVATVKGAPYSYDDDIAPQLLKNYIDTLKSEGKTIPSNPEDMTRDQFYIVNKYAPVITEYEITGNDIANKTGGLGVDSNGMFVTNHDALYERVQEQKKERAIANLLTSRGALLPKLSTAQAAPIDTHTTKSFLSAAKSALDAKFGNGWFDRLWGTGSFEAISDAEALRIVNDKSIIEAKYSKDGKIEAFYNPADDKVYFVPENISKDRNVAQLALHEIGVHMMRLGQNQEEFNSILDDIASKRESNPLIKAAFASAEKAGTKAKDLNEEALAHLIDKHPELKLSQRFIAWFKQAVRGFAKSISWVKGSDKLAFIQRANKLDEKDWVYMAVNALRSAPTSVVFKGDPNGGGAKFSGDNKTLLAPNGKPSNLNAMQHAQVRTPEFLNWFGDWINDAENASKVVDENGEPRIVYHITKTDSSELVPGGAEYQGDFTPLSGTKAARTANIKGLSSGAGVWFAYTPSYASENSGAGMRDAGTKGNPNIIPVFLNIKKPLVIDSIDKKARFKEIIKEDALSQPATPFTKIDDKGRHIVQKSTLDFPYRFDGTQKMFLRNHGYDGITLSIREGEEEVIAFTSNQIKSATGNNGNFDAGNNDVRFSKSATEPEEAPQFDFNVSDTSFFDKVRTKMQDRLLRVLQFQNAIKKQGGIINDLNNVHMAAEIAPNIAASTFKSIESNLIEPLQARMAKLKDIDNKVIFMLMYAKHAPERNAYIQSINKKFKGRDAGSGMSNEYAADLIATYKEKYGADYAEIESIANDWQKLTTKTRELLKASGDVSPETAQAWEGMFDYYVPLKGFEEIDTDGKATGNGTGMGFSIANKFSKATLGRESLAGQGIENIVIDLQRAVVRASNIYVQKTLVNLIHDNPNDDKWEVDVTPMQPVMGKTKTQYHLYYHGSEVAVRDTFKDAMRYRNALIAESGDSVKDFTIEHTGGDPSVTSMAKRFDPREDIAYWENGKKVTIKVHDKSFTDAFNNLEDADVLAAFTAMSAFNRVLRTGYTSFNPTFLIKNMLMVDPIVAGVTLSGRKGFKFAGESLKNIPAAFWNLTKLHAKGNENNTDWYDSWIDKALNKHHTSSSAEWNGIIDRYRKAGGSMDVLFIGSLEKTADDMDRALNKSAGRIKNPKDILYRVIENKFFDMINILSNAGEQGTRLATFKTAIDSGMSDMQAASLANNVTVNFGRRGSFGREAGAMWLFFNAGMQGTQNLSNVLTEGEHKEKAWGLLGSLFLATFIFTLLGDSDGDDEDDADLTSESEKQRNFVLNIFGTRILWKMPYGISFFADLGRAAADIVKLANAGKATPHELNKIAGRVESSLFTNFAPGSFNPMPNGTVDVKDAVVSAAPTLAKPFVMSATNRNSFGGDLVPDKPFNTTQPDSEKSYRKTKGSGYDKFAKWMNKVTGGDEANEGLIDVSPETLKMGANYLGGGAGKWVTEFASMLTTEGGEMGVDKIPTLNSIVKVTGIDDYRRRYYDQAHEVTQVHERYKAYEASGNKEGMKRLKAESGKLLDLYGEGGTSYQGFKIANKGGLKDKIKEFRELQDAADKKGNKAEVKRLEVQERMMLTKFNKVFDSIK